MLNDERDWIMWQSTSWPTSTASSSRWRRDLSVRKLRVRGLDHCRISTESSSRRNNFTRATPLNSRPRHASWDLHTSRLSLTNQPLPVRRTPYLCRIRLIDTDNGRTNNALLKYISVRIQSTDTVILHVSAIPKQNFIDLIIYILSGLSFWLGFCPQWLIAWFGD